MKPEPRIDDVAALRAHNIGRVLSEIRRLDGVARVDLAKILDLSPATVTAAVTALLQEGLVEETAPLPSAGRGRPRIELTLAANAKFVAGAKLNAGAMTVAILNFRGEVVADATSHFTGATIDANAMVASLFETLNTVLQRAGMEASALSAFGLGVPGFVEVETGLCHWSPLLTWTSTAEAGPINIRGLLEPHLSCPVFVDNDTNLAALAELWFGHGRGQRNFLVATVEHGVGLGIVIDGRLYRGARGLGAEFGHTKVQIDGALCRCGQRGCLEAYVADFALAREARAVLSHTEDGASTHELLKELAAAARRGDPISASIYARAGRMLGLGLANLINIFDPGMIILSGERMQNFDLVAAEVDLVMNDNSLRTDRPRVGLKVHRWGDSLWARGAGALALDGLAQGRLMMRAG